MAIASGIASGIARGTARGSSSTNNVQVSYAGTVIDDSSIGVVAWVNPSNAQGNQATLTTTWTAGGTNRTSHYLNAQNYNFTIPTSATILGIRVGILRAAPLSPIRDSTISLLKGGVVTGNNEANTGINWVPASAALPVIAFYGGATDLWGTTWTPADINNSVFGMVLSVFGTVKLSAALVFSLPITVYYK